MLIPFTLDEYMFGVGLKDCDFSR